MDRPANGGLQPVHDLLGIQRVALREFGIAVARISLAGDSVHDPLADVAGQMDDEVADRVAVLVGTLPKLFGGQKAGSAHDLTLIALQLLAAVLAEIGRNWNSAHKWPPRPNSNIDRYST